MSYLCKFDVVVADAFLGQQQSGMAPPPYGQIAVDVSANIEVVMLITFPDSHLLPRELQARK